MTTVTPVDGRASDPAPRAGGAARTVAVQVIAVRPAARDAATFALALPGTS